TKYSDAYTEFVERFARLVLTTAQQPPEPAEIEDLESLPNAFHDAPATAPRQRPATDRRPGGPSQVTFIVAAKDRETMKGMRKCVDAYGVAARDWKPYQPTCLVPVALRAQAVAIELGLFAFVDPVDDSLLQKIEDASLKRELVVLIVDPWTVKIPSYAR